MRLFFVEWYTDMNIYIGKSVDGGIGKGDATENRHAWLCLETQGLSDGFDGSNFESIIISGGHV